MLCGLPTILSDQIRGRFELIQSGQTGFTFPCGDVDHLARLLRELLVDPGRLATMGSAARQMMKTCSPQTNVRDFIHLLDQVFQMREAVALKGET